MQVTFNNTELHLQEHPQHEFLLSNKEVALGYGITQSTLRSNFNNNKDELIENKHWLRLEVQTKGGKQKVIHWTKKGIVRLGFFIKSEKAKAFRDWAEDYIVNDRATHSQIPNSSLKELQETILKQNALIAATTNTISQGQSKHKHLAELYEKTLNENETLKQKMTQQLSLIVSQVSQEIMRRFEESLDVTSRSLELQQRIK